MRSSLRFGLCLLPLLPLILSPAAAQDTPPRPGDPRIHVGSMPGWRPNTEVATRSSGGWRSVGPQSLYYFLEELLVHSGRVVSFAPHPTDPKIVYIGSASGGVWKTIDGGLSWMPLTDELPNLNQGCVALAPSRPEEVWVGTGEFSVQSGGAGVFRSTDGGKHWVQRGTVADVGRNCAALMVDPTRPEIVHFAGTSGYARTGDGGATWRILLDGEVSSLVARPDHPQTLYAVRYVRDLEHAALFRSVDGGDHWQRFSELPDEVNRVTLAIAPSQPEILYALADHNDVLALYKSIDGGRHWSSDLLGDRLVAQGWYNQALIVDRHDAAKVWAGGQALLFSPDGGESWILHGRRREFGSLYVHLDLHALAWGADGELWLATDGGVYSNADPTNGLTWKDANHNLATTQSYSLALHPTEERSFLTGTQDNGTLETRNGNPSWEAIFGGDGFSCAYDPFYPERRFATSQYGYVGRLNSHNEGDSQLLLGPWLETDPLPFATVLAVDPNVPGVLMTSSTRVWRTLDSYLLQPAWSSISPHFDGAIRKLVIAPSDSSIVWASADWPATVWLFDGAVQTWVQRSAGLPAGSTPADLRVDPKDPGHVYVGLFGERGRRIFVTSDYGLFWRDITGALPDGVSLKALAVDWRPAVDRLFVGTDVGVYRSEDQGASWEKDGADLPNVNIGALEVNPLEGEIVAATYGRGVWVAPIDATSTPCHENEGICLTGQRFRVEISWRDASGATGKAKPAAFRSEDSGLFYFFDPSNLEILVKVLDGCAINGNFWVYSAATTDVEYRLEVTDTATGEVRSYFNPLGQAAKALTDSSAFATCEARFATAAPPLPSPQEVEVRAGACSGGEENLCLGGGRFEARVQWQNGEGEEGAGRRVPQGTADSGLFYFFSPNNWEMLVKVLDGCAINGHFWVLAAATTDVGYTLEIEDKESGQIRRYRNELGQASPAIIDISAFGECSGQAP